ncbi:hypothetical protein C8R45DRAFT_944116 [Mycena sanguinolenta]|nr:hypothetical protein C8R45DRAFT_944116 [Mycena sanguinolenta]
MILPTSSHTRRELAENAQASAEAEARYWTCFTWFPSTESTATTSVGGGAGEEYHSPLSTSSWGSTHLFKKIQINPPGDPPLSSCEKFYQFLSSSPHIAPLVEDLCVVTVLVDPETLDEEHQASWITGDTTLSLILPLLNLTRISLLENAATHCRRYSMNWSKMERPLKSALISVFSSSRLEAVHIRGIVIESAVQLLSLFSEATGLKEMSLSHLYFRPEDRSEPWPESQLWRSQLQSLLIHLGHVRTLTVAAHSTEINKIVRAAKYVERLRVFLPFGVWTSEFLGTNLHSCTCPSVDRYWRCWVPCSKLVRPILASSISNLRAAGKIQDFSSHAEFATINTTLDQLCDLKTIELCRLNSKYWNTTDTFAQWEAAVQAALPSLERRGMLRITENDLDQDIAYHRWE